VKVDPKQTCEDAADKVLDWVGVAFLFILMMYGLTFGFDQAAPLFGLPQASPLEVGGLLLSVRLVVHEVRYLLLPLQLYLATVSGNCIWQLYLRPTGQVARRGHTAGMPFATGEVRPASTGRMSSALQAAAESGLEEIREARGEELCHDTPAVHDGED
jgi:hypothetical protein